MPIRWVPPKTRCGGADRVALTTPTTETLMARPLSLAALLLSGLCACDGGGSKDTSDTGETTTTAGFTLEGSTSMLDSLTTPAPEGLCIDISDPTALLSGSDSPTVLSQTTVDGAGAWTAAGIPAVSAGLLAQARDCGFEGATFPSANHIPPARYAEASDGDTVDGITLLVITEEFASTIQSHLAVSGFSGDISSDGMIIGFILDSAGVPIDGATLPCSTCTVYYADGDPTDGLFTSKSDINTSTSVGGGGLFVAPAAPITSYRPEASGYTFESAILAPLPEAAIIITFAAD